MLNEDLQLKSRYVWLRIPVISWLILVFPLILPPIPLGPIQLSLSWDRFEEADLVKRARRFVGRPGRALGFPMGWVVNVIMNLVDLGTLGLRSAFMAAWLADKVNAKATESAVVKQKSGHVSWLLKCLLFGNVPFLASWIVYPGWVLYRFAESIESVLYDAYAAEPLKVHPMIQAKPALSSASVIEASKNKLVLLGVYSLPLAPSETRESDALVNAVSSGVLACAEQILAHNADVFWCNVAQSYSTHYKQIAGLLPASARQGGRWIAFRDGKILCTASSASESIAMALDIPAIMRVIDNMRIDTHTGGLGDIKEVSLRRPVVMFILKGSFGPADWIKVFSPLFLDILDSCKAGLYFVNPKKNENLSEELRQNGMLWTGCVVWDKGEPVERIKMGLFATTTSVIAKITTKLSSGGEKCSTEHRYRSLPCHVLVRWDQVMELSVEHPLLLASGLGTQLAESAFLRWVGGVFVDRGFSLAVAPAEMERTEDSVASGLRAAGFKSDGCYVVLKRRVVGTVAKVLPQSNEAGWLNDAAIYLADTGA